MIKWLFYFLLFYISIFLLCVVINNGCIDFCFLNIGFVLFIYKICEYIIINM